MCFINMKSNEASEINQYTKEGEGGGNRRIISRKHPFDAMKGLESIYGNLIWIPVTKKP